MNQHTEKNVKNLIKIQNSQTPLFKKQIGKTTYLVEVHFSETSRETLEDKIKRMIREEAKNL